MALAVVGRTWLQAWRGVKLLIRSISDHAGTIIAALGAAAMVYGTIRLPAGDVPPPHSPALLAAHSSPAAPAAHGLRSLSMSHEAPTSHSLLQQFPIGQMIGPGMFQEDAIHVSTREQQLSAQSCDQYVRHSAGEHSVENESLHCHVKDYRVSEIDVDAGREILGSDRASVGGGDSFMGALCLVGNCAAMSGYFVLARRLSGEVSATALTVCMPCPSGDITRTAKGTTLGALTLHCSIPSCAVSREAYAE